MSTNETEAKRPRPPHNGQLWVITGGRNFTNSDTFNAVLEAHTGEWGYPEKVAHCGHVGADAMAQEWADKNGIDTLVVKSDNARDGGNAIKVRNDKLMMLNPNALFVFFGGIGAGDLLNRANEALLTKVINVVRPIAEGETAAVERPAEPAPPAAAE